MAKRQSTLVGLEIEPSAIHAASVTAGGRLSVQRAGHHSLEPGIVRDGEVADVDGLTDALRSLFRDNKLDKRVRIGVANQKIVMRTIDLPPIIDRKELATAVRFQAQDQLPMPLDAAVLDFHPLGVVDTPDGPRQRVVLVAARRDMVDRVLAAARAAGLRPEGLDLAAFGMVRALHRHSEPTDTVLYLSVGGLTNLAVATGTHCSFTRVVGGGLEGMVVELAERRQLTLEHARGWLAHVGYETPAELIEGDAEVVADARSVLLDGVRRIGGEVRNSVDFHHAQGTDLPVARCVLTGPVTTIPGFSTALGAELALEVVVGLAEGTADMPEPGRMAVAAGLAVAEAVA